MFLTSTSKSLLNATLLVCVFLFAMQSAPATSKSLCATITDHTYAMELDCRGNGRESIDPNVNYVWNGSCLTGTVNGASRTSFETCKEYNPRYTTTFGGGSYCPTGSNRPGNSPQCECRKGTNWSVANQKCK